MNDDRLLDTLHRLGAQELSSATDRLIQSRLETAWSSRRRAARSPWRALAPLLAAFVLVASFGGTALGASADSPLWDMRVTLEAAGAYLRINADDRVAYLIELARSRTEEAARQEALGHAGAAAKAHAAVTSALVALGGAIPQIEVSTPSPSPSVAPVVLAPTPTPSPERSAQVSASPAASAPSTVRSPAFSATPSPARTEPPHTATPTPAPTLTVRPTATPAPQSVYITGVVRYADGTAVNNACVTTSSTVGTSCGIYTKNGSFAFATTVAAGRTITLYAYITDTATGITQVGSATGTTTAPTTFFPTITLTPRR